MAYEKHTWETGEVITADKLNNIENGIPDLFIIELEGSASNLTLKNCTYSDILERTKTYPGDSSCKPIALFYSGMLLTSYFPANYQGQPVYTNGIEFQHVYISDNINGQGESGIIKKNIIIKSDNSVTFENV